MKNLKPKIGVSLTALACLFTLNGCFSFLGSKPKTVPIMDSNVMDVVTTIDKIKNALPKYKLPNGNIISFDYKLYSPKDKVLYEDKIDYFQMGISKKSENSMVAIRDYHLNNLNSQDEIIYCTITGYNPKLRRYRYASYTVKFGELPSKVQKEIKEEYNLRIKEAPEMLLKKYEQRQQKIKRQREKQEKEMENKILDVLK